MSDLFGWLVMSLFTGLMRLLMFGCLLALGIGIIAIVISTISNPMTAPWYQWVIAAVAVGGVLVALGQE